MPSLRIKAGSQKGQVFEFGEKPLVVGRDPGEGLTLLDMSASRRHAEFFQVGEMCFVRDLESKNGTIVNDRPVDEELLKEGDRVRIGETVLVFETGAGVAPPAPAGPEFLPEEDRLATTMEFRLDGGRLRPSAPGAPREAPLEVLYQVLRAMASLEDPKALLAKVLGLVAPAVGADSGYVFVKDDQKGVLSSQASWGQASKVSGSIVRRAMQEKRAVLTAEAATDMRFRDQQSVVMHRIGPVVCAPLLSHEASRGAIYLSRKIGGARFAEEDLELVAAAGAQAGIAMENVLMRERQRANFTQMVRALVAIAEIREPDTKGHAERVAAYSLAVARQMGLPKPECHRIQLAALLHDIGKIVLKQGQIQDAKGSGVRIPAEHVVLGVRLLERVPDMAELAVGAKYHHERMDGSGFPSGAKGDEIPLAGRILMLTNWYDNLTTTGGIGHEGLPPREVLKELQSMAGHQFDMKCAQALMLAYRNGLLYAPEVLYDEGWAAAV